VLFRTATNTVCKLLLAIDKVAFQSLAVKLLFTIGTYLSFTIEATEAFIVEIEIRIFLQTLQ